MEKDKEGYTTKDYLDALANRVDIIENEIGKIKTDIYAIDERAHNTDEEIARLDADIDAIYSGTLADDSDNETEGDSPKVGGTESEEEEEQIELNQIEWENCLIQNSKQIEKAFSYIEPLKELNKKEYLKQYKKIIEDYNYFDKPETIYDVYTKEQIDIICRCIETEAYGAYFDGKVNVACVILNRVESDKFPSDPISVIKESNQFAYGRTNISEDTLLALEYAFMIEDTTNGCIAFRSDSSPNKWGNLIYKFTDNVGHSFYYTEERSNDN